MKTLAVFLALCAAQALAAKDYPGDPQSLAQVLASEPASASGNGFESPRFEETMCSGAPCQTQGVTFVDSAGSSDSSVGSSSSFDDGDAEFDAQVEQIDRQLKQLDDERKQGEECENRMKELKAERKQLREQLSHLQKEKEKKKLQDKLEKQMRDLSEINRMSRALRLKFSELKRAQKLIKTTMMGTRGSLNALDMEPEMDASDAKEAADNIGEEIEALHSAQSATLAKSQKAQEKDVRQSVNVANEAQLKAGSDTDLFAD